MFSFEMVTRFFMWSFVGKNGLRKESSVAEAVGTCGIFKHGQLGLLPCTLSLRAELVTSKAVSIAS